MIQIGEANIKAVSIYKVSKDLKNSILGTKSLIPNNEEVNIMKNIFLEQFSNNIISYEFFHNINLEYNVLFNLVSDLYNGGEFNEISELIVKHLQSVSKHPNIKDGEIFIVKFEELQFNNKFCDAIGIFKYENKSNFIVTSLKNQNISLNYFQGIGNKKPEKACLILLTERPYTIYTIDDNKSDIQYWNNDFLNIKAKSDSFNLTTNFLNLTKSFFNSEILDEINVTKLNKIDLLNSSLEFIKSKKSFDINEFENEVLPDKNIRVKFKTFTKSNEIDSGSELPDKFEISAVALRSKLKTYKSVLKLDKNFHIYIHNRSELIVSGIEKDGRKYYKIYYDSES